jgi:type IV secretion system protein VirD4
MRLNPAAAMARGGYQETYGAFGPPRSGKTTWMAQVGLEAPGACLFTSTRADLARDTAAARLRQGPVYFINPGGDGGFPSNLGYSPLAGCEDPRMAMESAGTLMHAAPHDTSGKDAHWDHQSKVMLQLLMHAAALTPGASILTVLDWASDPARAGLAAEILHRRGAPGWRDRLVSVVTMSASDERYWSAISSGVTTALSWLDDPALADLACPAPGAGFDARQVIRDRGTVYLIGADTPHNPLSPYFACFASYWWTQAKRMAADPAEWASRDLRLDPPLTMIVDEPIITCPVPLDRWAAESGGHGITLVTGFQSDAQLPQRFGEHAGQALEDILTVKLVFGGVTGAIAEKASRWAGEHDTWFAHKKDIRQVRTFPPERICALPIGQAFVKHRSTRAFIAEIADVRDHPLYERAVPGDFAAPARVSLQPLAIGPPRRDPIVVPPPARPAVTEPAPVPALTVKEDEWPAAKAASSAA